MNRLNLVDRGHVIAYALLTEYWGGHYRHIEPIDRFTMTKLPPEFYEAYYYLFKDTMN